LENLIRDNTWQLLKSFDVKSEKTLIFKEIDKFFTM
jgi:hypothetical protein